MNSNGFRSISVKCADDYVMMGIEKYDEEDIERMIDSEGIDEIIISPEKGQIRITLKNGVVAGFVPQICFLRKLWDMNKELNTALIKYLTKGLTGVDVWSDGTWGSGIEAELAVLSLMGNEYAN